MPCSHQSFLFCLDASDNNVRLNTHLDRSLLPRACSPLQIEIIKNFAFVEFESTEIASKAREGETDLHLHGRTISIEYAAGDGPSRYASS